MGGQPLWSHNALRLETLFGGGTLLVRSLTLKFDRASWLFLKSTFDMKLIDMGKFFSDMTWAIS